MPQVRATWECDRALRHAVCPRNLVFDCHASGGVAIAIISRTLLEATRLSLAYGSRRDSPLAQRLCAPTRTASRRGRRQRLDVNRNTVVQRRKRYAEVGVNGHDELRPGCPGRAAAAASCRSRVYRANGTLTAALPLGRPYRSPLHRSAPAREANVVMVRAAHRACELHVGTEVVIASPHRLRMFSRRKRFPLSLHTDPPPETSHRRMTRSRHSTAQAG